MPAEAYDTLDSFDKKEIEGVITFGDIEKIQKIGNAFLVRVSEGISECAKETLSLIKEGKNVICLGSVEFANDIKITLAKLMIV